MKLKAKDIKPLRDQLIETQNGICPLCEELLEVPCLDHDHRSGYIRGVLCRKCNTALGKFENGVIRSGKKGFEKIIAKNLLNYINIEREEIHPTFGKVKKRKRKVKETTTLD